MRLCVPGEKPDVGECANLPRPHAKCQRSARLKGTAPEAPERAVVQPQSFGRSVLHGRGALRRHKPERNRRPERQTRISQSSCRIVKIDGWGSRDYPAEEVVILGHNMRRIIMNRALFSVTAAALGAFVGMPSRAVAQENNVQLYECVTTTTTLTRYVTQSDGSVIITAVSVSQKVCTPISG